MRVKSGRSGGEQPMVELSGMGNLESSRRHAPPGNWEGI